MDISTSLSIIIPNYRERRLMEVYARIKWYFPKAEIILSDDLEGKGKGWALREGFKKSTGNIIVFLDGDMDIHPKEIKKLLRKLDRYDIVVGRKKFTNVNFRRKLLSVISRKINKWLFRLPVFDTQTGLKVFKRPALSLWTSDSFAYDCEILSAAHSKGYSICEVPIEVKVTDTKSLKTILRTLIETIKIKLK